MNEILKTSAADSYFSAAVVVYSIENLQIKVCVASNLTQWGNVICNLVDTVETKQLIILCSLLSSTKSLVESLNTKTSASSLRGLRSM